MNIAGFFDKTQCLRMEVFLKKTVILIRFGM